MKEYRLFIFSVKLSMPPSIYSKKWCSKTVAVVPVKQNRSYSLCPVVNAALDTVPGKKGVQGGRAQGQREEGAQLLQTREQEFNVVPILVYYLTRGRNPTCEKKSELVEILDYFSN